MNVNRELLRGENIHDSPLYLQHPPLSFAVSELKELSKNVYTKCTNQDSEAVDHWVREENKTDMGKNVEEKKA